MSPSSPPQASPVRLVPGTAIGDHVIAWLIGVGGSSSVYAARHRVDGRLVAIKVMNAAVAASPKMVERFVREVNVMRYLRHPSLVDIFDIGRLEDGRPYYVMEHVDGVPLSTLVQRRGRLPLGEVIEILEPVCTVLQIAHEAGVVHRDVKASNILVAGDEAQREVKLLDFGVAKLLEGPESASGLTTVGRVVGTVSAMAPEQILGAPVDARADVYALGLVLYLMLTGQHAFWSDDEMEVARRHIEEPPPRPSQHAPVPPPVDAVVLRCLEKDPARRFESARRFFEALCEAGSDRRAAGPDETVACAAAAIHVEVEAAAAGDEIDAAALADVGRVLDAAEEALERGGLAVVWSTGNAIFAARTLDAAPDAAREGARAALDAARALAAALARRDGADASVTVSIAAHVDGALVRPGAGAEIVGGRIADVREWPLPARGPGLHVTRRAAEQAGAEVDR